MAESNLSLPEYGTTLIIGTDKPLQRQSLDSDAIRHKTGSAAIREHSGRPSENQDTKSAVKVQTYFVLAPSAKRVKIGKSACVKKRFAALSCAAPEDLVLLGVLNGDIERELHERFGGYRVNGEWFTMTGKLWQFLQSEFPGQDTGIEFVRYALDPDAEGGVPGRVTKDYEWGVRP